MATATDYLPEAIGGYLRLPRQWADSRPIEAGKTSLMLLIDQLDLLSATMDRIFDAVVRVDADALIAHGRFLQDKFGHAPAQPLRPEPPPDPPPVRAAAWTSREQRRVGPERDEGPRRRPDKVTRDREAADGISHADPRTSALLDLSHLDPTAPGRFPGIGNDQAGIAVPEPVEGHRTAPR